MKYSFLSVLLVSLFFGSMASAIPLTLNDLVVGVEQGEAPVFPLRASSGYGELYLEPVKLTLSPNCAGHVKINGNALVCEPQGNSAAAFVFARYSANRKPQRESDSGWWVVWLDWDSTRATLQAVPDTSSQTFKYFLKLR